MISMKCMLVLLVCVTQVQGSLSRRRRQAGLVTTAGSAQQQQQQQQSPGTSTGGNTGPVDPERQGRLVKLLLQAQQNINTANQIQNINTANQIQNMDPTQNQNQNQIPTPQMQPTDKEQLMYLMNLLKLVLQTRLRNMYPMTPRNVNLMGGRRGGRTNIDGRDRTVFTPYGKVTYDGSDVSYDMEY